MEAYQDLGDYEENERIRLIGERVMHEKRTVGFVTDNSPGKADRYIAKLSDRFPGIRVIARGDGPVKDTVWVKVGPPIN